MIDILTLDTRKIDCCISCIVNVYKLQLYLVFLQKSLTTKSTTMKKMYKKCPVKMPE